MGGGRIAVRGISVHLRSKVADVLVFSSVVVGSVKDAADQAYDYVVWTTKALPELTTSPELLAPLLDPAYTSKFSQPVYVNMQNGLDVERDLYEALVKAGHKPQIIGTAVGIGIQPYAECVFISAPRYISGRKWGETTSSYTLPS